MNDLPQGLKAYYSHRRVAERDGVRVLVSPFEARALGLRMLPHGGVTCCRIVNVENGLLVAHGSAWCSGRDNYCKRLGRRISMGRALAGLYA